MTSAMNPAMTQGQFCFDRYHFDPAAARLGLFYSYENGAAFEETITFPPVTQELEADDLQGFSPLTSKRL